MNIFKYKKNKGFSLIEVIVSLAVFAIAATVASGAFLNIITSNKKAEAAKTIMNNLNYAMESMTREMRTGSLYQCFYFSPDKTLYDDKLPIDAGTIISNSGLNCPNGGKLIAFRTSGGAFFAYFFNTDGILYKAEGTDLQAMLFYPVTSIHAHLNNTSMFYVTGNDSMVPGEAPKVMVVISGIAGDNIKSQTEFNLQTSISQRI